jgi:hypothetical protein
VHNLGSWAEGTIENLSQTGVLFQGPQPLPVNALVEMKFEMPEEISGQKNRNVLCQGRVIRTKDELEKEAADTENQNGSVLLAASIIDYKFVH